ncbi:MAG TPA: hypothetical protein VLJ62_04795, partial [Burkholderiaceae bacterium]|nr:hypothetical protein [Burkholderiaceae bacterium]
IVDLYLVAARSADDAQRYARRLAIDPQLVGTRRVTLNIDAGTFARVLPHRPALPAVVRMRGQDLAQLSVSEL